MQRIIQKESCQFSEPLCIAQLLSNTSAIVSPLSPLAVASASAIIALVAERICVLRSSNTAFNASLDNPSAVSSARIKSSNPPVSTVDLVCTIVCESFSPCSQAAASCKPTLNLSKKSIPRNFAEPPHRLTTTEIPTPYP